MRIKGNKGGRRREGGMRLEATAYTYRLCGIASQLEQIQIDRVFEKYVGGGGGEGGAAAYI